MIVLCLQRLIFSDIVYRNLAIVATYVEPKMMAIHGIQLLQMETLFFIIFSDGNEERERERE